MRLPRRYSVARYKIQAELRATAAAIRLANPIPKYPYSTRLGQIKGETKYGLNMEDSLELLGCSRMRHDHGRSQLIDSRLSTLPFRSPSRLPSPRHIPSAMRAGLTRNHPRAAILPIACEITFPNAFSPNNFGRSGRLNNSLRHRTS
jgi:hypothetical protein